MSVNSPAKPPLPWLWTVRGMRTALLRTPRDASSSTAVTDRNRPPNGPSITGRSASVLILPGIQGVPDTVTNGRSLPTSSAPITFKAAATSSTARVMASARFAVLQASDVDRHGEKNLQGVSTRPPKKPGEQLGVLVMTWTTDHLTSPRSVACRPRPAPLARYSMASARSRSAFQSSSELAKATPALAPTCSD